jgi:hypothetical protein
MTICNNFRSIKDEGRFILPSETITSSAEFTRTATTDDYAIGDAVNDSTDATVDVLEFAHMARAIGLGGLITDVIIETDNSADVKQYRLHLFTETPTAMAADTDPFPLLYADRDIRACEAIDVGPVATETSSDSDMAIASLTGDASGTTHRPYQCASDDVKLYGFLETLTAGTPVVSQKYKVTIKAILD